MNSPGHPRYSATDKERSGSCSGYPTLRTPLFSDVDHPMGARLAQCWRARSGTLPRHGKWPRSRGLMLAGVRRALPHVRQVGGRHLLIAGAVAAGALAVGGLASRAQRTAPPRGTPQGGPLSPLLANIYLHPFDVALTTQGLRLVRFHGRLRDRLRERGRGATGAQDR